MTPVGEQITKEELEGMSDQLLVDGRKLALIQFRLNNEAAKLEHEARRMQAKADRLRSRAKSLEPELERLGVISQAVSALLE